MELAPYWICRARSPDHAGDFFWVQTVNSCFTLSANFCRPYEERRVEELRLALINLYWRIVSKEMKVSRRKPTKNRFWRSY